MYFKILFSLLGFKCQTNTFQTTKKAQIKKKRSEEPGRDFKIMECVLNFLVSGTLQFYIIR